MAVLNVVFSAQRTPPEDILAKHEIPTEDEFLTRIRNYFGRAFPGFQSISRQTILDTLNEVKTHGVPSDNAEIHIDLVLNDTNSDIQLDWHVRDGDHAVAVDYSVPLFELIMGNFSPAEIEFSKAIKTIDNPGGGGGTLDIPDIIFRVKKSNLPNDYYFGDLSNAFP